MAAVDVKMDEAQRGNEKETEKAVEQQESKIDVQETPTMTTADDSNGLDIEQLQRRKFRAADLPLTTAQRQSIDNLLFRFKKGGEFDTVRKKIWADLSESNAIDTLKQLLVEKAEAEIDREPSLLSRERGKAATLIEGAVDRSDLYKNIDDVLNTHTSSHLNSILTVLRTLRRRDVSEEQAKAEEESGKKPDDEYRSVVEAKRREREIAHLKQLEIQKQKEIEEAKKQAEEAEKKREAKRRRAEEERKIREEREERRLAERERIREEQRKYDDLRDQERDERYDRRRREERSYRDDRDRLLGDRWEPSMDRDRAKSPKAPAPIDEKSLEDAALELLLKEGKELAERSRHKTEFNFDKADAHDPAAAAHASPSSKSKFGPSTKMSPDDVSAKRGRYDRDREPRSSAISDRHNYAPRIRDERDRIGRDYNRLDDRGRARGTSTTGGNDGYRPSYRRDSHSRYAESRSRSPDRRRYGRVLDWRDRDKNRERDRPGVDLYRPSAGKSPERESRRRSRSRSVRRRSPGGDSWRRPIPERRSSRQEDGLSRGKTTEAFSKKEDEKDKESGEVDDERLPRESDKTGSTSVVAARDRSDARRSPPRTTPEPVPEKSKNTHRDRSRDRPSLYPSTREDRYRDSVGRDRERDHDRGKDNGREKEREREREREREKEKDRVLRVRDRSRERLRDHRDRGQCHDPLDRGRSFSRSRRALDRDRDGSDHYRPARAYSRSRSPFGRDRDRDHHRRRHRSRPRSRTPSPRRRSRSPRPRRVPDGDRYIPGARGRSRSRSTVRRRRSIVGEREGDREREREKGRDRDRGDRERARDNDDRHRDRHMDRYIPSEREQNRRRGRSRSR